MMVAGITTMVVTLPRRLAPTNSPLCAVTNPAKNVRSQVCCTEFQAIEKSAKAYEDSCSNNAVQMCGNILPSRSNLRLRSWGGDNNNDDGDTTTTTCTNSQSTMCCDESGKNCEVKGMCEVYNTECILTTEQIHAATAQFNTVVTQSLLRSPPT